MSKSLAELAKRRAYLIEQSANQRAIVKTCMTTLRRPLAIADGGITVFLYLRTHPLVLLGSGLVYAGYRLKALETWSQKAWLVIGLFSKTRQFIKRASEEVEVK
jgi:hypothetical protein